MGLNHHKQLKIFLQEQKFLVKRNFYLTYPEIFLCKISNCKFKTYGCGSAIASSQQMIEMLVGKTLEEAKKIKDRDIAEILELPAIKIHCSVLAEDSIKKAIADYESKKA